MHRSRLAVLFAVPVALAACAQQEEAPPPRVIQGEPIFNKYGDVVGCEQGIYIPGAQLPYQCYPPDDQCDPQLTTFDPNCPPPRRTPNDPRDDTPPPRNPNVRVLVNP